MKQVNTLMKALLITFVLFIGMVAFQPVLADSEKPEEADDVVETVDVEDAEAVDVDDLDESVDNEQEQDVDAVDVDNKDSYEQPEFTNTSACPLRDNSLILWSLGGFTFALGGLAGLLVGKKLKK